MFDFTNYGGIPPVEEPPTEDELRELTFPESRGLYYVMPAAIMDSKRIKPLEKMLYTLLSGLAHKDGTCFPSDKYLAERLDVSHSYAGKMVKKLYEVGLIDKKAVPHPKFAFRSSRLITVHTSFKKVLRTAPQCDSGTAPQCDVVSEVIIVEENSLRSSKKNSPKAQTNSAAPQTPSLSFFKFKRVKMKMEAYDKLVKDHGNALIEEMLERLEEYADINPKRFKQYANHATVIRKWIREDPQKGPRKGQNRIKEVQEYIRSHPQIEALKTAKKKNLVDWGEKWIDFRAGPDSYILFENPKASDLIDHYVRKMGLKLKN